MGEQDESYLDPQKRQLELQEAEHEDRRQDRRREALNARYRATREEAMDRLRMGPTVPYDVLIRERREVWWARGRADLVVIQSQILVVFHSN